jgi:ornithine cyclodeaminase
VQSGYAAKATGLARTRKHRMQFFDQATVANALPYPALIGALASGLQQPITSPQRSHFEPNGDASTVLIMPAWRAHQAMGVKLVSIWQGNSAKGKSAVSAVYVLISCQDGQPIAVLDGTELTMRRTAAAAALAARILARKNSQTLAVLGTGSLSAPMALAHASVMEFKTILIWGRDGTKAQAVVDSLALQGVRARHSGDLQGTLAQADVVAAASTATEPFIRSDWVQPGTHLGLIGAFTPTMAEAEPALMQRAQVFGDSREAILQKGGEVLQAIQQGLIAADAVQAELAELAAQPHRAWRNSDQAITVFKSVGFASLDLIAAEKVLAVHQSSATRSEG